jgi:hypothetical protein
MPESCGSRLAPAFLHRKSNALNIEPMQPADRCLNRKPAHWPSDGDHAVRWIASGGSPLVFGRCNNCGVVDWEAHSKRSPVPGCYCPMCDEERQRQQDDVER